MGHTHGHSVVKKRVSKNCRQNLKAVYEYLVLLVLTGGSVSYQSSYVGVLVSKHVYPVQTQTVPTRLQYRVLVAAV